MSKKTLSYIPYRELERIRLLDTDPVARAAIFADACRVNTLYMIRRAGSGHIGTSFSCIDILSWLYLEVLTDGDRSFSSKGHDAPGLYAVLLGLGKLDFDLIHRLRRLGGLPGHPDVLSTPEIVTNTGSLGMGVSKARGFALANRLQNKQGRIFVLTGDGELQEGQFWESLQPTANRNLGEIVTIVDHNKIQSDTWVSEVSDLGDLEERVSAHGWAVARCNGNEVGEFARTFEDITESAPEQPKLIVADTLKGAGVSIFEPHTLPKSPTSLYGYHSGAPSFEDYDVALAELVQRLTDRLSGIGQTGPTLEQVEIDQPVTANQEGKTEKLVSAYGDELVRQGERNGELVVLDADLVLDCGLIPFRDRFPSRFIESGIAEQDMVSMAGALALSGLVPVVHSFACFLAPRPNEQIYNNFTEGTKIIYVGSLAGIVPGGPGHSHQSVRDIALFGSMPNFDLIEPTTEHEARLALDWAVNEAAGSVYIRLVSVPWELGFEHPKQERLIPGQGTVLKEGSGPVVLASGPVMVSQAWQASEILAQHGVECTLVSLPWLRGVDGQWISELVNRSKENRLFCIDNHYLEGGQGEAVLRSLVGSSSIRCDLIGVDRVPLCGAHPEVLKEHGLDGASIAEQIRQRLAV